MSNNEMLNRKRRLRRFIIVSLIFLLLITPVLVFILISLNPGSDLESKNTIREIAARQLNKYPEELTMKDFEDINSLALQDITLRDIRLLKKFPNLHTLIFHNVRYPKDEVPAWKKFLSKYGLINIPEKTFIDLSPIQNLSNIQFLYINSSEINDIKPLESLVSLQKLYIKNVPVADIQPLHKLVNLKILELEKLEASDITPLAQLVKLEKLSLASCPVKDIEPINKLTNLKELNLFDCRNIKSTQVKDLHEALPELKILGTHVRY